MRRPFSLPMPKWSTMCGVLVIAATVLGVLFVASSSTAAPQPYPVRLAHESINDDGKPVSMSPNGRFAIKTRISLLEASLVSMQTGAVTPSTVIGALPTNNGAYVFGHTGDDVQRLDVAAGTTVSATVTFPALEGWRLSDVQGADDAGQFVLLRASSGALARTAVFLFDFQHGQLVGSASVSSTTGDTLNATGVSISPDGNLVQYADFIVGGVFARVIEWNRATDQRREVNHPAEFPLNWDASADLQWVAFVSRQPGIVAGLSAAPRMYRRNLATGATAVIDVDVSKLRSYEIFNGGRVVLVASAPTLETGMGDQLFVSDPGGPTVQISVAPDGSPARYPVSTTSDRVFAADDHANEVTFTSYDKNLLTGNDNPEWRWYVVTLNAARSVEVSASAEAPAVRCGQSC